MKHSHPDPGTDLIPKTPFDRRNLAYVFLCASAAGILAILAAQHLMVIPNRYDDFIVGATTWNHSSKLRDLLSLPAFVTGFILAAWGMYRFFTALSIRGGREYEMDVIRQSQWWLLPVAAGIGGLMGPNPMDLLFLLPVGIAGLLALQLLSWANIEHKSIPVERLTMGLICVYFVSLLPVSFAALAASLKPGPTVHGMSRGFSFMALIFVLSSTALAWVVRNRPETYLQKLPQAMIASQSGLALLYALLIPHLFLSDTWKRAIQTREWLPVFAVALAIFTWMDLRKRWIRFKSNPEGDIRRLFSPWAAFTLILLFKTGQSLPPMIPNDDPLFGEGLLGWWSLREFGMTPHIEYITRNGIFGDHFTGFISWLFLDGMAGSLMEANRIAVSIVSLVAFFSLLRMTGRLLLSLIAVMFFATSQYQQPALNLLMLTPFIAAMFSYPPDRDANRWLKTWPMLVIAMVLLAPSLGMAMAFASLPAMAYHSTRIHPEKVEKYKWVVLGFLILATALSPLPAMLAGAVRHAWEEWSAFQVAYGTEWAAGYSESSKNDGLFVRLVLEAFRMSWAWVLVLSILTILQFLRRRDQRSYLLNVAIPVSLLILAISRYAMGSIDSESPSSAVTLSSFSLCILLPILLAPWLRGSRDLYPALAIVFLTSGMGSHSVNMGGLIGILENKAIEPQPDAASLGLFNIGKAEMEPAHADRLERVNRVIRRHLAYREPYLDLTGNQAHYMYFDRPPAMPTPSPFHLVPTQRQSRELKKLAERPPKLVLLEADNPVTPHGRIGLRSHLLYRYVTSGYRAELHDGFMIGFPDSLRKSRGQLTFTLSNHTDSTWRQGVHASGIGLMIRDSLTSRFLRPGDKVSMPDGSTNPIKSVSVEEHTIWLQNPLSKKSSIDEKSIFSVALDTVRGSEISERLFKRVFTLENLGLLPVAWGHSHKTLSRRMSGLVSVDLSKAILHDMSFNGGWYEVTGERPYLEMNFTDSAVNGRDKGLLSLDFECGEKDSHDCLFAVSWRHADEKNPRLEETLRFKAESGTLIIPLDSHTDWLMARRLEGIRISFSNSRHCRRMRLANARLSQRLMEWGPAEPR